MSRPDNARRGGGIGQRPTSPGPSYFKGSSGDGSGRDSAPSMQHGTSGDGYTHSSRIGSPAPRGGRGDRQEWFGPDGGGGGESTVRGNSADTPVAAPHGVMLVTGRGGDRGSAAGDRSAAAYGGLSREQELEISNELERELREDSSSRRSSSRQSQRSGGGRCDGVGEPGCGGADEGQQAAPPWSEPRGGSEPSAVRGEGRVVFRPGMEEKSGEAYGVAPRSLGRQLQRPLSQPPPKEAGHGRGTPGLDDQPHPHPHPQKRQQQQQPAAAVRYPGSPHPSGGRAGKARDIITAGGDLDARRSPASPRAYPSYVKRSKVTVSGAAVSGKSTALEGGERQALSHATAAAAMPAPVAARGRREGPGSIGAGAEGHRFSGAAMGDQLASVGAAKDTLDVLGGGGMGTHQVIQAAIPLGTKKVPLQISVRVKVSSRRFFLWRFLTLRFVVAPAQHRLSRGVSPVEWLSRVARRSFRSSRPTPSLRTVLASGIKCLRLRKQSSAPETMMGQRK